MKRLIIVLLLVSMLAMMDCSIAVGESLPDAAYIPGVVGHPQQYSISCEARSASDLAAFWEVNVGETEFLKALPSSDNPDQGYVGSPNEAWGRIPPQGYGVHADPVAATLRKFGLQAQAQHDLVWDDLRAEINAGRPVIVWVIGDMWPGTPLDYVARDGTTSRVAYYEHTMLLTGYSADSVEVIDAYTGLYQYYWLSTFLNSWSVLGNMAVFAAGDGQEHDESASAAVGSTYTVQPGDYLMELARDFGTSWQDLAQLNSIGYPFTIYAGQILHVPTSAPSSEAAPSSNETPSEPASQLNYKLILPIVVRGDIAQSTPSATPSPEPVKTVIVLHTNTLIGFGRSIGVAWHVLAKLNNLPSTYIVHPGEVLKVP